MQFTASIVVLCALFVWAIILDHELCETTDKLKRAETYISDLEDLFRDADPDTCMCGDSIHNHPVWDNHSPVSMQAHYFNNLYKEYHENQHGTEDSTEG